MTRAQPLTASIPSMLGLLQTPRAGNLYSLWFKLRFGPRSGMTSLRTVVADSDFDALKSAFRQVRQEAKKGAKLLGFTLTRDAIDRNTKP